MLVPLALEFRLAVFGADLAWFLTVMKNPLLRPTTRYVPDRDTITEVLIVLGIVIGIFIFSKIDHLPSFTPPVSSYASAASPRLDQK